MRRVSNESNSGADTPVMENRFQLEMAKPTDLGVADLRKDDVRERDEDLNEVNASSPSEMVMVSSVFDLRFASFAPRLSLEYEATSRTPRGLAVG